MVKPDGVLKNKCYCIDCMHNSRSHFKEEAQWGLCVLDEKVTDKHGECGSYECDFWFIHNFRKQVIDKDDRTHFVWTLKGE